MPDESPLPPSDDPTAYYAGLVREPCLLAEDVVAIALAEPETWSRFASTLEHSMGKAEWNLPFIVVRTHTEVVDGTELLFALLAMRHEDEDQMGAIFGEFACSPALYARHVKRYGLERPVPRRADGFDAGVATPYELDEMRLYLLLDDEDDAESDGLPI